MNGQNILAVMIYLFRIGVTHWGFTEQEEVKGLFSKDCILPCRFPPGHVEVIHWRKENKMVHSYYQQKDQLEEQDPHYRLRTHLFQEGIPSGNASLKLSNLTMADEGSYTCYVGTARGQTEVEVLLRIRENSSNTWIIVLGVLGAVAAVAAVATVVLCYLKKKKEEKNPIDIKEQNSSLHTVLPYLFHDPSSLQGDIIC